MNGSINREKSGRPSWRFKFTLRLLAAAVFLFAVAFAWFGWHLNRHLQRIAAVRTLQEKGASIGFVQLVDSMYDSTLSSNDLFVHPFDPFYDSGTESSVDADGTLFAKLCRLLGEEPPIVVDAISVEGRYIDFEDQDFSLLRFFPETKSIRVSAQQLSRQACSDLTSLSKLEDLALDVDQLPKDATFDSLTQLTKLKIVNANLEDATFRSICRLEKLQYVHLAKAKISASPESLKCLQNLSRLEELSFDTLSEAFLLSLPTLSQVRRLTLSRSPNGSNRAVSLQCLDRFPNLKDLDFGGLNPFGDKLFISNAELANLRHTPKLESLDLSMATVGDSCCEHVCRLAQLRNLQLACTDVTDKGMAHIGSMNSLEWLNISVTKVGDQGLREIWDLPNLQGLDAGHTSIQRQVLTEFFNGHPNCASGSATRSLVGG